MPLARVPARPRILSWAFVLALAARWSFVVFVPQPLGPGSRSSQASSVALEVLRQSRASSLQKPACPVTGLADSLAKSPVQTGGLAALVAAALGAAGYLNLGTALLDHHVSLGEDLFLSFVVAVTIYCLYEMSTMHMSCRHLEARIHTTCNAVAAVLSLWGLGVERVTRESPGLAWALLVPAFYLLSNFTMTKLMKQYQGPKAYKLLFELGQSFTLSFQGIHFLAWSSVYPELYWCAMPFWYWSLKKLVETVTSMFLLLEAPQAEDANAVARHKDRRSASSWGGFGLDVDVMTLAFVLVNFAAALADNAYMGTYTLRGPDAFFEVSRSLAEASDGAGWGSDHLRMALVKPAVGSLVVSMAVFLGTLVSRERLSLAVGVPVSILLSSLGPWLVFFWHRLVDPTEPWLPELMGSSWGPGPLASLLQGAS